MNLALSPLNVKHFIKRNSLFFSGLLLHARTHLRDTAGSFADPHSKVNTEKKLDEFFVLPVHIKVRFTLYCSLLNVQ